MSFKSVQNKIAKKEGVSKASAAAMIAKASRKAVANGSKNQNLKKVK